VAEIKTMTHRKSVSEQVRILLPVIHLIVVLKQQQKG